MSKSKQVPDILLERLALGELTPEQEADVRRRLEEEPDGLERLARLKASNKRILAEYPPRHVADAVMQRKGGRSSQKPIKHSPMRLVPSLAMLLIVVVSVGIIALVAIPNFQGLGGKARDAASLSSGRGAKLAQDIYYQGEQDDAIDVGYVNSLSELLVHDRKLTDDENVTFVFNYAGDTNFSFITKHDYSSGTTFVFYDGGGGPEPIQPKEVPQTYRSLSSWERRAQSEFNTETYDRIYENPFMIVKENPLSTFSVDVDTASYSNVRRFLNQGRLPPKGAVRIEELINYFYYEYPQPKGKAPFSVNVEIADCPWNPDHRLARIGLKGREMPEDERLPSNLVFLLDVSGSMQPANKLPLLKKAFKILVNQLGENDRVAIVVYAGDSGLALPSTPCDRRREILRTVDSLTAGGSTNAGSGINLAYRIAEENFIKGGNNRVILATDGDFNIGITNQSELTRLIEEKAESGVFLTVLGFGMGNYKDSNLELLADKGNGNYAYIDSFREARKVFGDQITGTLFTIAKDVKIQIEFNPVKVSAYRLLGYENRMLRAQDFNDDKKDAGEIGAGHTVTALYQIVPVGKDIGELVSKIDDLKYQKRPVLSDSASSNELLTVKLRYKDPDGDKSKLIENPVLDSGGNFDSASTDFRFAAAVASFGMLLRDSKYKFNSSYDAVVEIANSAKGEDKLGYRAEFVGLVRNAEVLQ